MPRGQYDRTRKTAPITSAEPAVTARPTRADEIRTERRRVPGSTIMPGLKLTFDESKLDRKTYAYRVANDVGNRVEELKSQDWDPVSADMKSDGVGTVVTKTVDRSDGKKAILMRKRLDWYDADKKEQLKPGAANEAQMRAGTVHEKDNPDIPRGEFYTPGVGNSVERA